MSPAIKSISHIKACIFDLDDTLYDCSGTLVLEGRKKVAKTIAEKINCTEEEAYSLQWKIEQEHGVKTDIFEKIVSRYKLAPEDVEMFLNEYIHVDVTNITLFPDVSDTLKQLKNRGHILFLVTSGDEQIQGKKIDVLGLRDKYFDNDKIFITERNKDETKRKCFQNILQRYNVKPEETACVGDKIDDELAAGYSLGLITVMIKHGRHYAFYMKEKDRHIKPDYFIQNIKDFLSL
jgi:putative hydrolase of the HAD superfamily